MMQFHETILPADMSEGDALDVLRLTCKARGLRTAIARHRFAGRETASLAHALDAAKSDLRMIVRRYA